MILRFVDYFNDFKCLAGDCKDTCCVGWELDIDEESFERYKKVEGDFGKRLRSYMVEGSDETGECNTFRLIGNRCPFLNSKNLCDIYTELGEKALCSVCTDYPRFKIDYGNIRERGLSLSCEAVGELVFRRKDSLGLIEKEVKGVSSTEDGEIFYPEEIEFIRDRVLSLMVKRDKGSLERIIYFFSYIEEAQEFINSEEIEELRTLEPKVYYFDKADFNQFHFQEFYDEIFYLLKGLDILDDEWEQTLIQLEKDFSEESFYSFRERVEKEAKIELWYEQLMNYLIFRYLIKAVYDADVLSKAKFILFSFLVIRMMMVVRFQKTGKFETEDMIDVARIYSKEVEHSEDNIAYLMEEFLFSTEFSEENIRKALKPEK